MKVFVAGGTGAIGEQLLPQLVAAGHTVVATTRSPKGAEEIQGLGAEPAIADGLNAHDLTEAVRHAQPEVVIHEMTALSGKVDFRHFDRWFATTNELRTKGTDTLVRAAQDVGARRLIVQSYSGWPNIREGGAMKTEEDPLDPHPAKWQRESMAAIRHIERTVPAAEGLEGVALRYGGLYGPDTGVTSSQGLDLFRKRQFPIVGDGAGVWSFIHTADAASATVAAVENGAPGVYNVVDDDPAPASEWIPYLAEVIGAKPPWRIPVWLGRIVAGEVPVTVMTSIRGSSNAKAKRELGWQPRYASWREGFVAEAGARAKVGERVRA
ncbi:MAG TPA: NAD(P)-dependent oxidoreductase [Solirubrobacterales bacterium]|jgi:nucleoside-diphosphate-sugar epimerase|nr:NAD(P)-dependent oxidoreductase [Solirubrobacterales bacterium]